MEYEASILYFCLKSPKREGSMTGKNYGESIRTMLLPMKKVVSWTYIFYYYSPRNSIIKGGDSPRHLSFCNSELMEC
jgi:hypothetical protein